MKVVPLPHACCCPLIGTFEPQFGDFGLDVYGHHWVWDGKQWMDENGKPAKTFEEWIGVKRAAD